MLFKPEAFEPLTETPWDAARARDGIRRIVADVDAAFDVDKLWPADEWDGWQAATPMKNLYVGAAGVILALDMLRRRGDADTQLDLGAAALHALAAVRDAPDFMAGEGLPSQPKSALLRGEAGVLVVAWRLGPNADLEHDLLHLVRTNVDSEADELMWGCPGTLLAARAMAMWTGSGQWRDAVAESAEALSRRRGPDGLWTQRLHGGEFRGLGPPHGVVGNVLALLDTAADEKLREETAALLAREAVLEDGLANWPDEAGGPLETGDGEIRVQWCAGAPGIVTSAASYLDEELLLAGAELPWRTEPPAMHKGSSICHGTAGNGYAFLKAFARTGDEEWLARARRFAMHALEQVERRGHGRYSLWTGDLGVALFVADCVDGRSAYPVLETWD
ncbi:MAG TPA: LanC-like protein [Gaiellaceae bacterium]